MARISDYLKNANGSTHFSFEVLPPLKGESIQELFNHVEPLMEFEPKFIDVTYHREEYVYRDRGQGLTEKQVVRKRPGTVGICAALMHKFKVETVPHIICGGFSKEETENALIDLNFLGIENVMALRGDAIRSEGRFNPEANGHHFASDLVKQINGMNRGEYLDEDMRQGMKTNFCVGVAGYPEKHFESPNLNTDLRWLKHKVNQGSDYIVTQMFFCNEKFFNFVDLCRSQGITIPIVPGLKPITTKKQLQVLSSIFHVDFPDDLVEAVEDCKSDADVKKVGIEWCIEQSKGLKNSGVPCLHYYSMGKASTIYNVAKALF
jgi:methylenetetrahydrofolate reductase (NADPH)